MVKIFSFLGGDREVLLGVSDKKETEKKRLMSVLGAARLCCCLSRVSRDWKGIVDNSNCLFLSPLQVDLTSFAATRRDSARRAAPCLQWLSQNRLRLTSLKALEEATHFDIPLLLTALNNIDTTELFSLHVPVWPDLFSSKSGTKPAYLDYLDQTFPKIHCILIL
jgi:hypothetical protein